MPGVLEAGLRRVLEPAPVREAQAGGAAVTLPQAREYKQSVWCREGIHGACPIRWAEAARSGPKVRHVCFDDCHDAIGIRYYEPERHRQLGLALE